MRQALSHLKAEGLIISQQGKVHFISKPSETAILYFSKHELDSDIFSLWFELLASLIMGVVSYAAASRSVSDLAAMKEVITSTEYDAIHRADSAVDPFPFYTVLTEATHNAYSNDLLKFLQKKLHSIICQKFIPSSAQRSRPDEIVAEFRLILDAVQKGNGKAARDAAWIHLTNTARLSGLAADAA